MKAVRRAIAVALVAAAALASGCGPKPAPAKPAPPLSPEASSRYLKGRIAALEGDYRLAAQLFGEAAKKAPDQAHLVVAYADALYRAGDKAAGLAAIESAQQRFPRAGDVWLMSGRLYRKSRKFGAAKRALSWAIKLSPEQEDAYLLAARTEIDTERPGKARSILRRLTERLPESFAGHYRLGDHLLSDGKTGAAERSLRRAVALRPSHIRARTLLAKVLLRTNRRDQAISMLQVAYDRTSRKRHMSRELIAELATDGRPGDAVAVLRGLDRNDLRASARLQLAELAAQLGEWRFAEAAALEVASAGAAEGTAGRALLVAAQAKWAAGDGQLAAAVLRPVAPQDPAFAEARLLQTHYYAASGKFALATTAAKELPKSDLRATLAKIAIAEASGDIAAARALVTQATKTEAPAPRAIVAAVMFELRNDQPERAVAHAETLLALDPDHAVVQNLAGFAMTEAGVQGQRARTLLRSAVDKDPHNPNVLDSYGWSLVRAGSLTAAKTYLDRALALSPKAPEILLHRAELELRTTGRDRAIETLSAARRFARDQWLIRRIENRLRHLRSGR